jgi:hypothetical protein
MRVDASQPSEDMDTTPQGHHSWPVLADGSSPHLLGTYMLSHTGKVVPSTASSEKQLRKKA